MHTLNTLNQEDPASEILAAVSEIMGAAIEQPAVAKSALNTAAVPLGAAPGFYTPSPIKRPRRLKTQINAIKSAIREILEADHPQTVRQVFYALTVRGLIA